MKKILVIVLGILALGLSQAVLAADQENLGLGFNWEVGPQIPFATGFGSNGFTQRFSLSWMVGDTFTVDVFGESAAIRGSHSYTTNVAGTPSEKLVYNGMISETGIGLNAVTPFMDSLTIGIELGGASFTDAATTYSVNYSNGTVGANGDFGAPAPLGGTIAPLVGLNAKWTMISAKSKGLWEAVYLGGALRFVPIPDTNVLGTQEVQETTPSKIDAINNFNTLDITLGLTIGF